MGICGSSSIASTPYDRNIISISHFDEQRIVGEGGFGKVKAATRRNIKPLEWYAIKYLLKEKVIREKSIDSVWNERNILSRIHHPFIVNMHHSFHDETFCYVVLDLLLGGDLQYYLNTKKSVRNLGLGEERAKFYTACTLLAIQHLHENKILHRDIKPGNILLDSNGYTRLTDFGISYEAKDTEIVCKARSGTQAFMAPEILMNDHKHGPTSDFYSLGITSYQLMFGQRPFKSEDIFNLCKSLESENSQPEDLIKWNKEHFVSSSNEVAMDFFQSILHPNPALRLGAKNGVKEIMDHPWFQDIEWEPLLNKQIKSPFLPDVTKANCQTGSNDLEALLSSDDSSHLISGKLMEKMILTEEQQQLFQGFEFNINVNEPEIRRETFSGRFTVDGRVTMDGPV